MKYKLYTVGHSTQEFESFLNLLRQHEIKAVADVRSGPYSQRFPWFNRERLRDGLGAHGIQYVFLGEELGARRDEPCCYVGTRADYDLISQTPLFKEGLNRIEQGLANMRISLMCAEKDPIDCHRTILVARHAQAFTEVKHILNDGRLETHSELEERLMRRMGLSDNDLFLSRESQLALAYKRRGEEIAYRKNEEEAVQHEH
jgi:uncharacterized protein (DUF488 family)